MWATTRCMRVLIGGGRVCPVQATLPRRRGVRARVGVLEEVRGTAGDVRDSADGNVDAWERFS